MPANLLAIDTSTTRPAVALVLKDGRVFTSSRAVVGRHGTELIPVMRDLLRLGSIAPRDLDAIAVGLGPGSYTGLRIGLIAAKTLAYALGCRLIGLDSLEIVARNAPDDALRVSAVADAQRGDLFVADFTRADVNSPWIREGTTHIESARDWLSRTQSGTYVVGPAALRASFEIPPGAILADPEKLLPIASALLTPAIEAYESGRAEDPWTLEPVYLRRSAAEDKQTCLTRE